MTATMDSSPLRPLSLMLGSSESDPTRFVHDFEECFERHGCALVTDHDFDSAIAIRVLSQVGPFVSGAPDNKSGLFPPASGNGDRGASEPPFKTFSYGALWRILGERSADSGEPLLFPDCADGFRNSVTELIAGLNGFGTRMLAAVARFLWLKADWFDAPVSDSVRVLRLIASDSEAGGTDFLTGFAEADIISIIGVDDDLELEIRHRWHEHDWQRVTLTNRDLLVTTGPMLQRMTNDILKPPVYRLAETGEHGPSVNMVHFSLPFRDDFPIESIPECVDLERYPDRYPGPITAHNLRQTMGAVWQSARRA